jgi:hypothetical protein
MTCREGNLINIEEQPPKYEEVVPKLEETQNTQNIVQLYSKFINEIQTERKLIREQEEERQKQLIKDFEEREKVFNEIYGKVFNEIQKIEKEREQKRYEELIKEYLKNKSDEDLEYYNKFIYTIDAEIKEKLKIEKELYLNQENIFKEGIISIIFMRNFRNKAFEIMIKSITIEDIYDIFRLYLDYSLMENKIDLWILDFIKINDPFLDKNSYYYKLRNNEFEKPSLILKERIIEHLSYIINSSENKYLRETLKQDLYLKTKLEEFEKRENDRRLHWLSLSSNSTPIPTSISASAAARLLERQSKQEKLYRKQQKKLERKEYIAIQLSAVDLYYPGSQSPRGALG